MEVQIDVDKSYPVYSLEEGCFGLKCFANKRKVQRWKRVIEEYNKVQDEMEKAHDRGEMNVTS